jgi:hypothetical protein
MYIYTYLYNFVYPYVYLYLSGQQHPTAYEAESGVQRAKKALFFVHVLTPMYMCPQT